MGSPSSACFGDETPPSISEEEVYIHMPTEYVQFSNHVPFVGCFDDSTPPLYIPEVPMQTSSFYVN